MTPKENEFLITIENKIRNILVRNRYGKSLEIRDLVILAYIEGTKYKPKFKSEKQIKTDTTEMIVPSDAVIEAVMALRSMNLSLTIGQSLAYIKPILESKRTSGCLVCGGKKQTNPYYCAIHLGEINRNREWFARHRIKISKNA